MNLSFKQKIIYGAIVLGVLFPAVSFCIALFSLDMPCDLKSFANLHTVMPSMYLIDLAPFILAIVAFYVTKMVDERGLSVNEQNQKEKFYKIERFVSELGKGNFEIECDLANSGDKIGIVLDELKKSLSINQINDKLREWENEGVTRFSIIQRDNNNDIEALAKTIIQELAKYLEVNYGGFYIIDISRKKQLLKLKGSYGYDFSVKENQDFEIGEGLIGQCFKDSETIIIDNVPEDYLYKIESTLGKSSPKMLVFIPLVSNEKCVGVIELTSLKKITKHQIEFVEKLSESLAISIQNVENAQVTKDLLEESQFLGEQMQAQEEELRQNAEELQATQEEIERKLEETESILESERRKINSIVNTSAESIILTTNKGSIKEFNPSFMELFGYSKIEIEKLTLQNIFNSDQEFLSFINNAIESEEEIKVLTKDGNEIWVKVLANQIEVNNVVHYSVFLTDHTVMRQNMIELNDSLTEFQSFMIEQSEIQQGMEDELEKNRKELEELKK